MDNLSSANTEKVKETKQDKLEEVLAVWAGQLNIQSGGATDEIVKEGKKCLQVLCVNTVLNVLLIRPYFVINVFFYHFK